MADTIPPTGKISDGFFIISFGFVAMYILASGKDLIAFDTGMTKIGALRGFKKLGLDPNRVTHIFFTHSDRDHVGGVKAFPKAALFLSVDEVAMLDRTTPRFFSFVYNKPFAASYTTLVDGQKVTVGATTIACIATPGHTAGSMSFLVNGSHLIVGDILNISKGKVVMDRASINIDNEKRRQSIRTVARLTGIETLCPMHSGYTRDFSLAMEDWRD
jgi:hydroxyacylglutathione hydrolase